MRLTPRVEAWPCSVCRAPGVKNLGAGGYCAEHLDRLLAGFSPAAFGFAGIGLRRHDGVPRPELGDGCLDLRCPACDATWAGPRFESCWWCERRAELMVQWAAEAALVPPDVNPDDVTALPRLRAWAVRLERHVDAGIVNRDRAEAAVRRAVNDVAA